MCTGSLLVAYGGIKRYHFHRINETGQEQQKYHNSTTWCETTGRGCGEYCIHQDHTIHHVSVSLVSDWYLINSAFTNYGCRPATLTGWVYMGTLGPQFKPRTVVEVAASSSRPYGVSRLMVQSWRLSRQIRKTELKSRSHRTKDSKNVIHWPQLFSCTAWRQRKNQCGKVALSWRKNTLAISKGLRNDRSKLCCNK